jgi:hypothetical protein
MYTESHRTLPVVPRNKKDISRTSHFCELARPSNPTMSEFSPYKSIYDVSQIESGNLRIMGNRQYKSLRNLGNESDLSTEVGDRDIESDKSLKEKEEALFRRCWGITADSWIRPCSGSSPVC